MNNYNSQHYMYTSMYILYRSYQGHPGLEDGSGHSHDHDDYGSHSHSGIDPSSDA